MQVPEGLPHAARGSPPARIPESLIDNKKAAHLPSAAHAELPACRAMDADRPDCSD